jgi:imidazolonepropionase-like amidohydrolase
METESQNQPRRPEQAPRRMSERQRPVGREAGATLAITGARILFGDGATLASGVLLVRDGRIAEVGETVTIPDDVPVIDARGKVVAPGFIDAHTHLGVHEEGIGREGDDTNDLTDPLTPHLRALDGINPVETGLRMAAAHGVSSAVILPGSGNVIGGLGTLIKTWGDRVDDMVVRDPCGLKIAFGENPKRVYGDRQKMPSTRMGTAALLREAFVKARDYDRKMTTAEDPSKVPDRDLRHESLVRVLHGEFPLLAHAHRADDIHTALRIADEFGVGIVLQHATEAHLMADDLAARGTACVVGPTFGARGKIETQGKTFATLGALARAGVKVAICSDHPVTPSAHLRLYAALAVREGMDRADALRAVTIWPAEISGVADRVGTIAPGKDADFTVYSGDPLDPNSTVVSAWQFGRQVGLEARD